MPKYVNILQPKPLWGLYYIGTQRSIINKYKRTLWNNQRSKIYKRTNNMLNNWRFLKKQYDYIHNLICIYLLLYAWSSTLSCVSCSINDPEEYFSSTDIRERANLWCITIFLLNGGQKWFNTKWLKRNSRIQIKNAVWSCKDRFFKTKPKRVRVNVQWEQVWPETDVTVLTDDFFWGGDLKQTFSLLKQTRSYLFDYEGGVLNECRASLLLKQFKMKRWDMFVQPLWQWDWS